MRTIDQIIKELPPGRRAKIATRTRELITEEMALQHLRKARELTQQAMASLLRIDQAGVSKIESRSDMLLSTLRSYVEAMGGSLRLVVEFPDGVAELASFGETATATQPAKRKGRLSKKTGVPGRPQLVHANG